MQQLTIVQLLQVDLEMNVMVGVIRFWEVDLIIQVGSFVQLVQVDLMVQQVDLMLLVGVN